MFYIFPFYPHFLGFPVPSHIAWWSLVVGQEARRMLSDPSEVAVDMKGQEQVGPQMPHFVFFVFFLRSKKRRYVEILILVRCCGCRCR